MERASRQWLRAIRGKRSQAAFSRRLGYKGNPVASWEAGRRFPTAVELVRACGIAGLPVVAAFEGFHPEAFAALETSAPEWDLSPWLRALCGTTPTTRLAERTGRSRFAIRRWLSGEARPRVPDFLRLLDAMTGRASDLVFALVPLESVPALAETHRRRRAAKAVAFEEPWTEAVLRVLETRAYRALPPGRPGWIAARLGIDLETERRCLERLKDAGVIAERGGRYDVVGSLTVDTRAEPARMNAHKAHWGRVGLARLAEPRAGDIFSYNVMSLSREDLERVRAMLRGTFREIRSIVAATPNDETAALLTLQLLEWPCEPEPDAD